MKIILLKKKHFAIVVFLILFTMLIFNRYYTLKCETFNKDIDEENYQYAVPNLIKGKDKVAYLTFDDGPTVSVTPKILKILDEENIKATFFVIGKRVDEHPEIVKEEYEKGHFIANHTYSHDNSCIYHSPENFIEEIRKTDEAISNAIGEDDYCSHLFRFPNGYMAPLYKTKKEEFLPLLFQKNYTYLDWNCLTKDAESKTTNYQLIQNLKNTSKDKDTLVVLMHDTKDVNDSSLVLKDCIKYLKSQGYKFESLQKYFDD